MQKKTIFDSIKKHSMALTAIVLFLLTAFQFSKTLEFEFTNYDEIEHVLGNNLVRNLDVENIGRIFSSFSSGSSSLSANSSIL